LSLLSSLPYDATERVLFDSDRDMLLVVSKALDFRWHTTMSLLFLGAKGHCITASELQQLEGSFGRRTVKACRTVLEHYHARTSDQPTATTDQRLEQLH